MSAWHGGFSDKREAKEFSRRKKLAKQNQEKNALEISYNNKKLFSTLASLCIGITAGVGALEVASFVFPFSILIAVGVGLGFAFASKFFVFGVEKPRMLLGGTKALESKIIDAEDKLRKLEFENQFHRNSNIGDELEGIIGSAYELLDLLEGKPDKIVGARDFLGYYLDECISMIQKHKELEEGAPKVESGKKIEEVMVGMNIAFERQLDKIRRNEAVDLDLDIQVLKNDLIGKGVK